jgi:hypothetical protein
VVVVGFEGVAGLGLGPGGLGGEGGLAVAERGTGW